VLASEARQWILDCLAGVYQPMPKETIWAWAERTLIIPRGGENDEMAGQKWSTRLSPYVREVMDWFRSPGKQELFVCKSSQVGLTMCVLIVICWHIVHRPTNIGYCIDSKEEARKISKSRLKRWILDNGLLKQMGEDEDDMSNMTYFLRGMMVHLMGAYSEGAFRNKALGIGILDELDAHPPVVNQGTTADAMRSRLKRHRNSKLLGFSKPKLETDQTWSEYLTGTQEKFFCPCPLCGHEQPLEWKHVQYKGKEFEDLAQDADLKLIRAHAWYKCEMGCRIEESMKMDMLDKGDWRATNPKALPNKRSMHISDLYSAFVTWGELAVEWIEAQKNIDKLTAFVQDRLGEPMKQLGGSLRDKDILRLREKYERGTCPVRAVLTAIICDVQMASLKWGILCYTAEGDMVVVDYGECMSFMDFEEIMKTVIPSPFGDLVIQCGLVDEGDGKRAIEVRKFTQRHEHIFPVKGRGSSQMAGLIVPSISDLDGVEVLTYHINDNAFKRELLFRRIKRDAKNRDFQTGRLILPWRICENFVDELMNEVLVTKKDRFGFEKDEWHKKGPNDYLDVLKYGLALWSLNEPVLREAGLLGVEAKAS
jgi:phage terminase large subunit GpA-like protein